VAEASRQSGLRNAVVGLVARGQSHPYGVFGSAVDESNTSYRYQRAGGSLTSWTTSDSDGFTLSSADPGDSVDVEVREYDRAGNLSASTTKTLQVPVDTPVAHDSFFALPVIACVEWCPVIAAGVYAGSRYFWYVNQNHYDWNPTSSSDAISVTPAKDESQSFEDAEARAKSSSRRKAFRREGEIQADGKESIAGRKRTTSSPRARRPPATRAGCSGSAAWIQTTSWPTVCGCPRTTTGACTPRTTTRPSTGCCAANDPTFGSDPCGQSSGGVDVDGQGLKRAMEAIKNYVKSGTMP
jgi:hypothetical protein